MKRLFAVCFILLLIFCSAKKSFCKNMKDEEDVFAIQDKIYHHYHELGLFLSYIPDDDFYEVFPIGLSYTFNFNDYLAWEVVRGLFAVSTEKDIKKDLEKEFGVTPSEFSKPKYMLHSHVILKPLYGKQAIWNRGIINNESYVFFGGGLVGYETEYSYGSPGSETAFSISFGIGTKYFLNEHLCLNLEIRDMYNFKERDTENNISFGLGLGFRFDLSPRKADTDSTIDTLRQYLRDEDNE